jgi:hypothetical protein
MGLQAAQLPALVLQQLVQQEQLLVSTSAAQQHYLMHTG